MSQYTNGISTSLVKEICYLDDDDFICINVCGMRYETLLSTLEKFPTTLLGNKERRKMYYVKSKNCYFFDRSSSSFEAILYYYQSGGILIRPPNVPMFMFVAEIIFFDLGEHIVMNLKRKEGYIAKVPKLPKNYWQRKIWQLFEEPDSSSAARFVACWSIGVIAVSIIIFCMETMPMFQDDPYTINGTKSNSTSKTLISKLADKQRRQPAWFALEVCCITWFTVEYVIRLITAPNKRIFVQSFLNVIDLLAILPYFIILTITDGHKSPMLRVVRLVRVFRVFKLSRHSNGLQILGHTLKASISELGMLVFFLLIAVILFSSAIYYAEESVNKAHFRSIPDAFWYSLVTMTTVGYGDKAPITLLGKVIGSLCAVSGVLTIALPVPVIVANFEFFYKRDRLEREEESENTYAPLALEDGNENEEEEDEGEEEGVVGEEKKNLNFETAM